MNWRRPLIWSLLRASGSQIPQRYKEILNNVGNPGQLLEIQRLRLSELIRYAREHVPYYRATYTNPDLINEHGMVEMDEFHGLPFLGKAELRDQFPALQSTEHRNRHTFENSSGGSTGEPVRFIQDRFYREADIAATLFLFKMAGKELGDPELKLWGSERDILEGSIGHRERLENWLYNRTLVNSFRMDEFRMQSLAAAWNKSKPLVVWSYVDSIFEFARFVKRENMTLVPPKAIITTAGTLDEHIRSVIESTFNTSVLNQYGSREVGVLGCEEPNVTGLRLFEWKHYVEVIDEDGRPCAAGKEGDIVVTCLENFSMPLIRFKIGDRGVLSNDKPLRRLSSVTGRITDHFVCRDGTIIHGEYFSHLFYFKDWVKRFQIVQTDYDRVTCFIVLQHDPVASDIADIESRIQAVMGRKCEVRFNSVEDIQPSKSGKFLYTRCEVSRN